MKLKLSVESHLVSQRLFGLSLAPKTHLPLTVYVNLPLIVIYMVCISFKGKFGAASLPAKMRAQGRFLPKLNQ